MPNYQVRGVNVSFPFQAYRCQEVFMEKLIAALQARENALLESPTETWSKDPPKILYASRTHSQLSQVAKELQKSGYKVKACVLGSRDQTCIHPYVSKAPSNAAKTNLCRQKMAIRDCTFGNNVDKAMSDSRLKSGNQIMDIEELVGVGKELRACPYYISREQVKHADILLLPYYYLLDPQLRELQKINLDNAIIIFDEAHNLEASCGEVTSFELTSNDLLQCIEEARSCISLCQIQTTHVTGKNTNIHFTYFENVCAWSKLNTALLQRLQQHFDNVEIPKSSSENGLPGKFMYDLFARVGVSQESAPSFKNVLESAVTLLINAPRSTGKVALSDLLLALNILFRTDYLEDPAAWYRQLQYYKVHVQENHNYNQPQNNGSMYTNGGDIIKKVAAMRVINYWCFNSGVAMRDLIKEGVRSIILASGTLSPLEGFAVEMQIGFKHQLENPHVIKTNQAFVSVVSKGPMGVALNSSYSMRGDINYKNDLGNAIVNIARTVPGGILVFFPSYGVMYDCIDTWKRAQSHQIFTSSAVWDKLCIEKAPIVEPRNKIEFPAAIETYYRLTESNSGNGAILFAVCRGKVSEGIDFSNARARAVIITGIPFPAAKDPKILLKKRFLDEMRAKNSGLSGMEWYKQQAARTVNQAIGRVIRHKDDFGAIILCDERFSRGDVQSQLSLWLRPLVRPGVAFGEVVGGLSQFFRQHINPLASNADQPALSKLQPVGRVIKHPTKSNLQSSTISAQIKRPSSVLNLMAKLQSERPVTESGSSSNSNAMKRPISLMETFDTNNSTVTEGRVRTIKTLRMLSANPEAKRDEKADNYTPRQQFLNGVRASLDTATYDEFQTLIKKWKFGELQSMERDFFPPMIVVLSCTARMDLMEMFTEILPEKYRLQYRSALQQFVEQQNVHSSKKTQSTAIPSSHSSVPQKDLISHGNVDAGKEVSLVDAAVIVISNTIESEQAEQERKMCHACTRPIKTPFLNKKCKHVLCYECWWDPQSGGASIQSFTVDITR